jgi:hypothetical protein
MAKRYNTRSMMKLENNYLFLKMLPCEMLVYIATFLNAKERIVFNYVLAFVFKNKSFLDEIVRSDVWRTFKNPDKSINIKWCGKDFYDCSSKKMRISTIANLCYFGKLHELQMLSRINRVQFFDEIVNRKSHDIDESDLYKDAISKSPFVITIYYSNFKVTKWIIDNIILLEKKISFILDENLKSLVLALLHAKQFDILKYILENGRITNAPDNTRKLFIFLIDIFTHIYDSKCSEIINYMMNSNIQIFHITMNHVIKNKNK